MTDNQTPWATHVPTAERSAPTCADHAAARFSPGNWWVLHTRARHEKRVVEILARRAVNCHLPLVRTERRYGQRVQRFDVPLFPGYVFLRGGTAAVEAAWQTNRVARVLHVRDQQRLCHELAHIERVIASGVSVNLYPSLRTGQRCRVIAGPLQGTEGIVLRRRNQSRLYMAVTFIAQSAVVEIDAALLEPLD